MYGTEHRRKDAQKIKRAEELIGERMAQYIISDKRSINAYGKKAKLFTCLALFSSAEIETARNFHKFKTNCCVSKIKRKPKPAFKNLSPMS